jgi:glycogen synthase
MMSNLISLTAAEPSERRHMRVLFWSEYFWPYIGGSEVFAINLLPALQERGYEFLAVASHSNASSPDETEYRGIPIYRFPFREALAARDVQQIAEICRRMDEIIRRFRSDLVHMNSIGATDFFLHHATYVCPTPYLITMQQYIPREAVQPGSLLQKTLRGAERIVCCSANTLGEMREMAPDLVSKSTVIYPNVEAPALTPRPVPFDPPTLLCVGRALDAKGIDLAITAFSIAAARFPDLRLLIAGAGPALPALRQQVAALDIVRQVKFLGWIPPDEIPVLMDRSTIVVMPSRVEPFGLVALQAAQMARPVVGTRVGGLPEIVLDQETGLLVESEDVEGLAHAIVFLLEHPETTRQIGEAARRRALGVFNWDRYVRDYDALYRLTSSLKHRAV